MRAAFASRPMPGQPRKEIFLLPNVSKGDFVEVAFIVFRDAFDTRNILLLYLVRLVEFCV